ncbi:putative invertase inhibitor [Silene latifolia]|uniref:putative invertase inhibitor n=1 Tax=Silene latifolia TaxID=37657 RepID=UPI003D784A14
MIPCVFFTLLTFIILQTPMVNSNNLINQTCKNSSMNDPNINYNFCIKAFHSSPSSRDANLTRLGLISINLVKHNSSNTTSFIKTLIGNHVLDSITKKGLKDCLELYSNSVSTLFEAARDFRAKRLDDANVKVSSVMDDCSTCEDGFDDIGVFSPLTKQNNDTFQLSAIALSIIDMLHYYVL